MARCSSCDAEIVWARHVETTRWMPLDAYPLADITPPAAGQFVIDQAFAKPWIESYGLKMRRYVSHFSTCPNAKQHRSPAPRGRQCMPISIEGQISGFICGVPRAAAKPCAEPGCGAPSIALCDFPLGGKKAGKTCSRPVCERHRHQQGKANPRPGITIAVAGEDTVDYCPAHHRHALANPRLPGT